jgi:polyhydroxyalkanoate synthesis regulator phasin
MAMRRKVIAGAAAALAVGGAGAGVAATKMAQSPSAENKAVINDAAKSLGVEPGKLDAALKKAIENRIDAAVAAGRLTKEQGQELKQRVESGDFPLFGPPAFGPGFGAPHPFFHGLDAAAKYLGLTEAQLESLVNGGKTLAQIAKAEGKSVAGLKAALLKDARTKLDDAVTDGHLSKADEQQVLKDMEKRIDDLVNGQLRLRFRDHDGFGFRHRFGLRPGFGFDRPGPPSTDSSDPAA